MRRNIGIRLGRDELTDPYDPSAAFSEVTETIKANQQVTIERPAAAFIAFMLALAILMAVLGFWQLLRLSEKNEIIARIETRIQAPPRSLPPVAEWEVIDPEVWDFRPVKMTGHFVADQTILVFTNLTAPKGALAGPGYWVMTPFSEVGGGTVLVNRGYIPVDSKVLFADGGPSIAGEFAITGIARRSERANAFTPGPDFLNRIDWIINVDRLEAFLEQKPELGAPFYVDMDTTNFGVLPQAGETKLVRPNRHMEYALTWFSLAGVTPILLGFWWRKRMKDSA